MRLKPIVDTASRIHSASWGVRASQARDEVFAPGIAGRSIPDGGIIVRGLGVIED